MALGSLSDAQYQERLRVVHKARDRQRLEDLRTLMANDWGRRLAYWLTYELAGVQERVFDGSIKDGGSSGQHMAFRDGRRAVGLDLVAELQATSPIHWLSMIDEANRERKADLALEQYDEPESDGDSLE